MTFNNFIKKCQKVTSVDMNFGRKYNPYYSRRKQDIIEEGKPAIEVHWSTGGIVGDSCWDDSTKDNHYAVTHTPESGEDELTKLDEILEFFCPNITFIQYKNLTNKLIHHYAWTENEYYGNCTNYSQKYVYLDELWSELKERGLLP